MKKVSHCHHAPLDLLGFCTKCKQPCKPVEIDEKKEEELLEKIFGFTPFSS